MAVPLVLRTANREDDTQLLPLLPVKAAWIVIASSVATVLLVEHTGVARTVAVAVAVAVTVDNEGTGL